MAAASVSFDGTRLSNANSNTDGGSWDKWDAVTNPAVEPDFTYEGANSQSNKVGTSQGGVEFYSFTGGSVDLETTPKVILVKSIATNSSVLNVQGSQGMIVYIGSGTTTDRDLFYTHGNDAYPIKGGWVLDLIDINEGYADTTEGTPNFSTWDYIAVSANFSATSKSENVAIDAIDYFDVGTGLTLVGGDGISADAVFDDLRIFDEDTATNRYGIVSSVEGILFILGMLTIGQSITPTEFTDDTGGTMVFSDGRFGAGTVGINVQLADISSPFSCTNWSFIGRGNATTADSRPDYAFLGTNSTASYTSCAFRNFRNWTMTSAGTLDDCIIADGLLVTQAGGTITDCAFSGFTGATATAYVLATDPGLITGCNFVSTSAVGHAVRCDTTGTYDWDGNTDSGYSGSRTVGLVTIAGDNDAMFYNNSAGLITLNVVNGAQVPSVRNGAGASTQVNNNTQITLTGLVNNTEVTVYDSGDGSEIAHVENVTGNQFIFSDAGANVVDIFIHHIAYYRADILSFTIPGDDASIPVQQTADPNYVNN